jgi:hypothetical protein
MSCEALAFPRLLTYLGLQSCGVVARVVNLTGDMHWRFGVVASTMSGTALRQRMCGNIGGNGAELKTERRILRIRRLTSERTLDLSPEETLS